jgi:hypothetical protein
MKNVDVKTSQEKRFFNLSVILDFIFEDGLLFISIKNLSDEPAFKISFIFEPPIKGLNGTKSISSLPLFKNIEFLAPHKEIKIFLDSSHSYLAPKSSKTDRVGRPEKISVKVSYRNTRGEKVTGTIKHDLGIYKEIGYIRTTDGVE